MRLNCKKRINGFLVLILALGLNGSFEPAKAANDNTTDVPPSAHFGVGPLDLTPLNLSADQKQKIQDRRKESCAHIRDLRKMIKEKRQQMKDLMFDSTATEAQLKERHHEMSKLREQVEDTIFQDFLFIRSLLTPEQKKHWPEVKPQGPIKESQGSCDAGKSGIAP